MFSSLETKVLAPTMANAILSRSTLSTRLTSWYTLASLSLLLAATGLLYWALAAELDRGSDLFLADKLNVVRTILRDRPNDWSALREEIELESAARRYAQFYIRLLDEQGETVLTTPGMDEQLPQSGFSAAVQGEPARGMPVVAPNGRPFRVLTASAAVGRNTGKTWHMEIAVDRTQEQMLLTRYRRWLWSILAVALALCPFVGYRIARHGIRPVERIAETARRISSTTLAERIEPTGYPIELVALAGTFNAMLDRLQDSFARLSQFSADIAHELRTPVNNIRGEAEVALARARSVDDYREVLSSCLEESVRLSDLIGNLLFLARSESPETHLNEERVDIHSVLRTVEEYFEPTVAEMGISLAVECNRDLTGYLDRTLFQQALGNLVSNALAHTPADGRVTLRGEKEVDGIRIEVQDTGVGIPPESLSRVFDRLYRVDRARSSRSGGTGLGLAIVKGIVKLHGGTAHIVSSPGVGTTVTLRFPFQANTDPRESPSLR